MGAATTTNILRGFTKWANPLTYGKMAFKATKNVITKDKSQSDQSKHDTAGKKAAVNKALNAAFYREEYYCGADVGIFVGGKWVDDIISIQYTLTNNKAPVHGYMSEEFDAVARGTYIVQGQLAIAFKENGYLRNILDEYQGLSEPTPRGTEAVVAQTTAMEEGTVAQRPFRADKYGYLTTAYEKSVGRGFDVFITFGDVTGEYRQGTIVILEDCHITSESLVAQPTGDPIAEVYSFFAKTITSLDPGTSWLTSGDPVDVQLQQGKDALADREVVLSHNEIEGYNRDLAEWKRTHPGEPWPSITEWAVKNRAGVVDFNLRDDEIEYIQALNDEEENVELLEVQVLDKTPMIPASTLNDSYNYAEIKASQSKANQAYRNLELQHENTEDYTNREIMLQPGNAGTIGKDE